MDTGHVEKEMARFLRERARTRRGGGGEKGKDSDQPDAPDLSETRAHSTQIEEKKRRDTDKKKRGHPFLYQNSPLFCSAPIMLVGSFCIFWFSLPSVVGFCKAAECTRRYLFSPLRVATL